MKEVHIPFEVTGWDAGDYTHPQTHGPTLSRATVTKLYQGLLEGEGVAELLMCRAEPMALGAGYVASELVTGSLDGCSGTFVMQHGGLSQADSKRTYGHIVPGSGTGSLEGLSGEVEIEVREDKQHFMILRYQLPA